MVNLSMVEKREERREKREERREREREREYLYENRVRP